MRSVAKAFAWGAVGGVLIATLLGSLLATRPDAVPVLGLSRALVIGVVFAPLVEEAAKALGLAWVKDADPEPEDGLIYGAAAGFGFAATENLLYGIQSLTTAGLGAFLATAAVRSVSSALVHGAATALVGLAMWRERIGRGGALGVGIAFLLAVVLHAAFNLAASTQVLLGFLVALGLAVVVFRSVLRRVRSLDALSPP